MGRRNQIPESVDRPCWELRWLWSAAMSSNASFGLSVRENQAQIPMSDAKRVVVGSMDIYRIIAEISLSPEVCRWWRHASGKGRSWCWPLFHLMGSEAHEKWLQIAIIDQNDFGNGSIDSFICEKENARSPEVQIRPVSSRKVSARGMNLTSNRGPIILVSPISNRYHVPRKRPMIFPWSGTA